MPKCPACSEPLVVGIEVCPHCGISVHESSYRSKESTPRTEGRKLAGLGLTVGCGGLVLLLVCGGILAALLYSAAMYTQSGEITQRSQCKNNLKQIGLALHNYHEIYGSFPPAFVADEAGRPMHSWRVLLLPFLDHQALYARYDLSAPWDGPHNSRLLTEMPAIYRCPGDPAGSTSVTSYLAVLGPKSAFRSGAGTKLADMTDGPETTAIVGESTSAAIPWTKPADIDITAHPALGDKAGFNGPHGKGVHFIFADGAVRWISQETAQSRVDGMYTIGAGDQSIEF